MSKMLQMKESTAKREVKQEYGLTETDGQAFVTVQPDQLTGKK